MKITDVAIDNRTAIAVFIFILFIQGIMSYVELPRESSPDVSIPLIIISTPYVGVSPEDIETLITQPIEKELNAIGEIKEINSSSFEGFSIIQAEFQAGFDIDQALTKVRDKVDKATAELPNDVERPEITEINFSEFPIMNLSISGPIGLVRLKELADDLKDDMEKVNGVLEVKISGGMEREVKVDVDYMKMEHYTVRFNDIIGAIADENLTIPGGSIDVNSSSFLIRVPGEYKEPYTMENIIVKLNEGAPIYLRDVATITYGFKDRGSYARMDGVDAVSIAVSKRVGENIIDIAEQIRAIIDAKKAELPDNIQFKLTTDYSVDIDRSVKELENNIFSGLVLVVLVLFFFLGVRNAVIVAVSIPLSMLISFIVLQLAGITLNFVTLYALILALGMLVDNAIVIVENIYNFMEEGMGKIEAAKAATREVAWPVATSTLTTLAAFAPLLFWPGIVGDFMYYIPFTVIVTLSSSLLVALLINPVIAAVFMKVEVKGAKPHGILDYILLPFNKLTHFFVDVSLPIILRNYERFLKFAIGQPRKKGTKVSKRNTLGLLAIFAFFFLEGSLAVIGNPWLELLGTIILGLIVMFIFSNIRLRFAWGSFLALIVITQFYFIFDHGVEFFPKSQPQRVYVNIETPTGTNLDATDAKLKEIEQAILAKKFPNIREMLSVVGATTNPFESGASTPNKGTITVQFVDYDKREETTFITTEKIRAIVDEFSGIDFTISEEGNGPPVGLPVNIDITGDDYHVLGSLAKDISAEIEKISGLVDLKDNYDSGKPEVRVIIDRERAAMYGMNTGLIASTIRTAINGTEASNYRVGDDEYDITVRLKKDQRESIDALNSLRVIFQNKKGQYESIPLMSVARLEIGTGPSAIKRKDLDRVVTVSGDAAEGFNGNAVLEEVKSALADYELPQGYDISFTGQSQDQEEASAFLGKAFFLAIFLIFMILVVQFNSISQPFIIMTAVLISLNGVFIGLILFEMPFGIIMTGIGVISLAGVVVNNNIVLIDYTNVLRQSGMSPHEAVMQAGIRRFRPVTLTAITTILGLIPLTFGFGFDIYTFSFVTGGEGVEFWRSMGIAVIFGLGFATFLTLIVVPVLYSIFVDLPGVISNFFRRLTGRKPEPEPAAATSTGVVSTPETAEDTQTNEAE